MADPRVLDADEEGPDGFDTQDSNWAPAVYETLHKASTRAINLYKEEASSIEPKETRFLGSVADKVSAGADAVGGAFKSGAKTVAGGVKTAATGVGSSAADLARFFKGLALSKVAPSELPEGSDASESRPSVTPSDGSTAPDSCAGSVSAGQPASGIYGVDYQRYPMGTYVQLPSVLQPFLGLPGLDHILCVARPTMDKSGGLEGYRNVTPKSVRSRAPFLIVVDDPGKKVADLWSGGTYLWLEIPLVDVFKLDVRPLKSVDDYVAKLSKKGKWNFKDRQKKFNDPKTISCQYLPFPTGEAAIDACDRLWPLYSATGEKNGFCVLGKEAFYDFHSSTPNLTIMEIQDVRDPAAPKLITFCTGVRHGDTLMPMWCGTDYDNELQRKCSTYFNLLYEFFKVAIADPEVDWVDLGATRRTAKMSIGCEGYPVSAYVRCKNSVMQAIVQTGMEQFFNPEELMNDP